MNRKLLFLRIFSILLLIATLGIFIWEIEHTLSTPSQDDIFGHTGTVFFSIIIVLPILIGQWEFYRGMKYLLTDTVRTKEKTICKWLCTVLSGVMLAVAAVVYLFFLDDVYLCYLYMWWTVYIIVIVHLATSVHCNIEALRDEENTGAKAVLIIKLICKILALIPFCFVSFVELMHILTILD